MKNVISFGICVLIVMSFSFVLLHIDNQNRQIKQLKSNLSESLCVKVYSEKVQSVSIHPAKAIPHFGIKPNQLLITCGSDVKTVNNNFDV